MALTREQILASRASRKPVPLDVPEWGGQVFVRVMTVRDQAAIAEGKAPSEVPLLVLLHCLVNEDGERILRDEDLEALASEDFPIIMRVFAFVAKLNGLSTDELEEAMASFAPAPVVSLSSV